MMEIVKDQLLKKNYTDLLDPRFSEYLLCDVVQFQSGETILQQGEELKHLYFLMRGKVKIYTTSIDGKRLIVAFNRPPQLFGDIEFIQQSDVLNTVEALGTVYALRFPLAHAHYLRSQTAFNEYLLELISRKFYTKSLVLSFHLLHDAGTRFASYLTSISHDEYGECVEPFVSKQVLKEIAEFIGITGRHQNRLIQHYIQENLVQRSKDGLFIVNSSGLKQKAKENIYEMQ